MLSSISKLTLGQDGYIALDTMEQSAAVEDLVQDDGEAVDISFLTALRINRQSDGARQLRSHQLRCSP